jgi:hypothetical protein
VRVEADGSTSAVAFGRSSNTGIYFPGSNNLTLTANGADVISIFGGGTPAVVLNANAPLQWSSDLKLWRGGAGILEQYGAAGAFPQTKRLYEFRTDAANYSRLSISCPTGGPISFTSEALGSGTARPFRFTGSVGCGRSGGSTPLDIQADGGGNGFKVFGTAGELVFQSGGVNGAALLSQNNSSTNGFVIGTQGGGTSTSGGRAFRIQTTSIDRLVIDNGGLVAFGDITSSYPALKRSTTTLQVRLGDDSADAAIQSLYTRFGSGSPESVVTAPVGAIFHRTDGGAVTSFYVKESGAGNTGWVAK